MDSNKADLFIPLYDLEIEGTKNQIAAIKPQMAEDDDEIYLYEEVMKAANTMDKMEINKTGNDACIILQNNISVINPELLTIIVLIAIITLYIEAYILRTYRNKRRVL